MPFLWYVGILWYVGNIRSAESSGRNFWWQQKWYFLKDFRLIDISHGYLVNRSGGTKFLVPALFGKKKGYFCLAKIIVHTFGKNSNFNFAPFSKSVLSNRFKITKLPIQIWKLARGSINVFACFLKTFRNSFEFRNLLWTLELRRVP